MTDLVLSFRVEDEGTIRLDKYLVEQDRDVSRTRWQAYIAAGLVEVDGRTATKTGQTVERGQRIVVRVPESIPTTLAAENIALDVVFENQDVLIINKPAGLVVHPAPGHDSGTLVNAVLGYEPGIEGIGGAGRPGIVHRLDKDTSGLIVVAKNDRAHRWLQEQFRTRAVEKTYIALVHGHPPTASGRVEADVGRDPRDRKKMAVLTRGRSREAVTEYRTLERLAAHSLLELRPLTGRTHQIRLHCAFLGCPIVGDKVYGRRNSKPVLRRHFLHAQRLRIVLPGEQDATAFEAPLPRELEQVLSELRVQA
jgi:23S rRNA pseudouridine1911/1915/1917 synthase